MLRYAKVILLVSCLFVVLLKPAGAQAFVKNAIHRSHSYNTSLHQSTVNGPILCSPDDHNADLQFHFSSHLLGDINSSTLRLYYLHARPATFHMELREFASALPTPIFKPPRLS